MSFIGLSLGENVEPVLLKGGTEQNGVHKHRLQQGVIGCRHFNVHLLLGLARPLEEGDVDKSNVLRFADPPHTAVRVDVDH